MRITLYREKTINTTKDDPEADEHGRKIIRVARAFSVFNRGQIDGLAPEEPLILPDLAEVNTTLEAFVAATGIPIAHGGTRAFYSPQEDRIQIPLREAFDRTSHANATENYYSTLFHELGHATGTKDRCNRDMSGRFGSMAYAMEELVADLTSSFLCAEKGISPQPRPDHALYIRHWLKVLKDDKRAIFTAAAQASKAVAYLNSVNTT